MPTSSWGPPTWNFLHTMAEKAKEETFPASKNNIFQFLMRICKNLPCPICSAHATSLMKRINLAAIKTPEDLKKVLFMMHNAVNRKKGKPLFEYSQIKRYSSNNLIAAYNSFIAVYKTRGNMALMTDSLHRQLLVKDLKQWIQKNIGYFNIV